MRFSRFVSSIYGFACSRSVTLPSGLIEKPNNKEDGSILRNFLLRDIVLFFFLVFLEGFSLLRTIMLERSAGLMGAAVGGGILAGAGAPGGGTMPGAAPGGGIILAAARLAAPCLWLNEYIQAAQ